MEGESHPEEVWDLVIIGGGPAGGTAALYGARASLRTLLLDKGVGAGALGSASRIANFPGVGEEISGRDLVERIRSQAERHGATLRQEKVLGARLSVNPKEIRGTHGRVVARTVIIATGSMGRTDLLPGEERLLGKGVSYCATCDGFFFQGEDVAVAGARDEALEEALFLARIVRRVHLLVPVAEVKAAPEVTTKVLAHPAIVPHFSTRVREIVGETQVSGVRLESPGRDGELLSVRAVFLYLQGGRPITNFLAGEVEFDPLGCLRVDGDLQTSVSGVFAAGDVLCRHLKQAILAAAEGARAAAAAARYLTGGEGLRPDWA